MSLQLPNLDDRRYKDLVEEALGLIPTYAPKWTNHNPSDPGITLIELFAYLTEILLYRLNRVTARNKLSFLKLLNGTNWNPFSEREDDWLVEDVEKSKIAERLQSLSSEELEQLVARQLPRTVLRLRRIERAASRRDYETLALEASPDVARARCLPRRNLDLDLEDEREGHVSVIVLPGREAEARIDDVVSAVRNHLMPRLLVTTQLHVVRPLFVGLTVEASIVLKPDQKSEGVPEKVRLELERFFDRHPDASRNTPGWPWGRNVFASEVYALLDQLAFVDYVTDIKLTANRPGRELPDKVGIEVKPYELVKVEKVEVKEIKIK